MCVWKKYTDTLLEYKYQHHMVQIGLVITITLFFSVNAKNKYIFCKSFFNTIVIEAVNFIFTLPL